LLCGAEGLLELPLGWEPVLFDELFVDGLDFRCECTRHIFEKISSSGGAKTAGKIFTYRAFLPIVPQ
jgi:hypothetical protein